MLFIQSVEGRSMNCFLRARPLVSHHVKKLSFYETLDVLYHVHKGPTRGWDSVVGVMSHYGLGSIAGGARFKAPVVL